MTEPRRITELAERECALFLAEQSKQFGECAINLMAHSMSVSEVIRWLERQIEMLKEFG